KDDAARPPDLADRQTQAAELRRGLGAVDATAAGIAHRRWLLVDLLLHVVGERAELDGVGLPIDPVDPWRDRPALAVTDLKIGRRQPHHLTVLEISHMECVWRDRRLIAREQMLPFANAHDQRAPQPRPYDLAREPRADDGQPIRPLQPGQDAQNGVVKVVA